MSVGEPKPAFGQSIDIGRDRLAVATDSPIVHVINGDEQNIGLPGLQSRQWCNRECQRESCERERQVRRMFSDHRLLVGCFIFVCA